MPTILSGVVDDADILSNQRKIDMDEVIHQLEPSETPLTTMLMALNKKKATSQKVEWLEDEPVPRLTTLAASATSADTLIAVAASTGSYFRAGDVLRVASTGENLAVTAVSTDSVGVTRSIGAVAVASAASGVDVVKIGNAAAEGATLGTLLQTKKVAQYNYCQIQRNPWGHTETLLASDLYGGNVNMGEKTKKLIEHKWAIENTLFYGQRDLNTSGSTPIGYCGGLDDYITTNITSASSITENTWEAFLDTAFRYGSRNKIVFAAPIVVRALSSFARGKLAIDDNGPGVKSYGLRLMNYQSTGQGGDVKIAVKRDWADFAQASPQLGGRAYVVDMDQVRWRPLRDTAYLPKRQANDEDSQKGEYLTEHSLVVGLEKTHALLRGITAYA